MCKWTNKKGVTHFVLPRTHNDLQTTQNLWGNLQVALNDYHLVIKIQRPTSKIKSKMFSKLGKKGLNQKNVIN